MTVHTITCLAVVFRLQMTLEIVLTVEYTVTLLARKRLCVTDTVKRSQVRLQIVQSCELALTHFTLVFLDHSLAMHSVVVSIDR